ncbi:MAG: hypothetical protein AAB197_02245, partial [Deltaproteobacteria bacterium]
TNEILDRLISLIDTSLSPAPPAGLGLVTIAKGDLGFYAGKDSLTVELPALFVKPSPTNEMSFRAMGQEYEVVYKHRLVYLRQFATTEKVVENKVKETLKIAELLIDNIDLNALALSNGQIIRSLPSSIEWEPLEDELVGGLNVWLFATAITFDVVAITRR